MIIIVIIRYNILLKGKMEVKGDDIHKYIRLITLKHIKNVISTSISSVGE